MTVSARWAGGQGELEALWAAAQDEEFELDYSLLQIAEQAIRQRYDIIAAFRERAFDELAFRRSAIEWHEQDRHRDEDSVVIDMLRDTAERYLLRDPFTSQRWLGSEIPILLRLGIHLLAEDTSLDAGSKVGALIERGLLYSYPAKHEVFRLLKLTAPNLDESSRDALLRAIHVAPAGSHIDDDPRLRERVIFDRLEWLAREVNDWPQLTDAIAAIRANRPGIGVREHPDVEHFMTSGAWGGTLPWTVEDYLSLIDEEGIDSAVDQLIHRDYSERDFEEPDWDSALTLVAKSVEARPSLAQSMDLSPALADSEKSSDLRAAIIRGLAMASLEDAARAEAIALVSRYSQDSQLITPIASLILAVIKSEQTVSSDDRTKLDALAITLWTKHGGEFIEANTDDWMSIGLNSWPGYIAQYWLERASRRIQEERPTVPSLEAEESGALRLLLAEKGPAGYGPLAVICNQLYFLFAVDAQFTTSEVIPLFQAEAGETAAHAWHAYLHSPRVSEAMLDAGLWDALLAMAKNEDVAGDGRLRSQFWDLFSVVLLRPGRPDRREPAIDAVTRIGPEGTGRLFAHLAHRVNDLDLEEQQDAWSTWIAPVRTKRLDRLPGEETLAEGSGWCDLFLHMRHVLPFGLELSLKAPAPLTSNTSIMSLEDVDFRAQGALIAELFERRLRHTTVVDHHLEWVLAELVEKLCEQGIEKDTLRPLVEACLQAGIVRAASWLD